MKTVHVYGGGLAGSEAASFLLRKGYEVYLHERRPRKSDGAHETGLLGELVCSNSLKSERLDNACGLLKAEMALLGSIVMESAERFRLGAGSALAVDRTGFARYIDEKLSSDPNFHRIEEEIEAVPEEGILCTGPLTDGKLLSSLEELSGSGSCHFFDATAPIVDAKSIDMSIAYRKNRFEGGDGDYINCPFDLKEDYFAFVNDLINAEKVMPHGGKKEYFEGCLPVEIIASRGPNTLRFGPLTPMGLEQEGKRRPYAVVQLRKDNLLGDAYNMVGFQTNLTYPEQRRVFSLIPGLRNAKFIRYGLMHRNSYLSSPDVLSDNLSFKKRPGLFAAGQLIGVEGYVESAASGIMAAVYFDQQASGKDFAPLPSDTMLGALLHYVTHAESKHFQPMAAVYSLLPYVKKEERFALAGDILKRVGEYAKKVL